MSPGSGETALFIHPGHAFKLVSGLITNFHLPKSSLLMLVSAFAGRENVLAAYREAVANRYRFYSYGDAMIISMKLPYEEFDLSSVKTYPLRSRQSKVGLAQFATPHKAGSGINGFLKSLPGLLAARDFKDVVDGDGRGQARGQGDHLGPRRSRA